MSDYEFVLINYPPSISTEKIRWVLTHYGIPFEERRMALSPQFLFAVLANLPRFRGSPPYLRDDRNKLYFDRAREVVRFFDPRQAEERQLLAGLEGEKSAEVDLIEKSTSSIGSVVRGWAYSYITPDKELFLSSITEGAPASQKAFTRALYPLIAFFSRQSLAPESDGVAEAHQEIVGAFDALDQLFTDQRQFVHADRFTFLDIKLCVHAAPCVMAPEYGGGNIFPAFESLPGKMKPFVQEFRDRPTGQYVLRMYRNFRSGVGVRS